MSNTHTPIDVFCSYAPEDESSFQQLQKHLGVLTHQERIRLVGRDAEATALEANREPSAE
jgi:hypothetical protein